MIKRILKIIIFVHILLFIVWAYGNRNISKASSNSRIYLVFDKTVYNTGEIVNLTINLDQFSNLNEIKLQIKLDNTVFEPILTNEEAFYFSTASIFTTDIINDYVDNSYLRLRLIKNTEIDTGYYSSYKNNICYLKLKVNKPIDNIYKYFTLENYETYGISIYLFDSVDNLISYELFAKDKIQINWGVECYELDVFSNIPDFKEDIKVLNREENEYEYLVEKAIDTSVVGVKTIHVGVYDKTTADYIIMSKPIIISDKEAPIIVSPSILEVLDSEINDYDYLSKFVIIDNYDDYFDIETKYYDQNLAIISNRSLFNDYLSTSEIAYIKVIAIDNSNNETTTEFIEVNVLDKTAPEIKTVEKIIIDDVKLGDFKIEEYFEVNDNYDKEPMLTFNYLEYNDITNEKLIEILSKGKTIEFKYLATDKKGNKTKEYSCKIIVNDTTIPVISIDDIVIDDALYKFEDLDDSLVVTDNFEQNCSVTKIYYIEGISVTKDEFNELIQVGKSGYIEYFATDKSGNVSDTLTQKITINDTTYPIVVVDNIKPGEKYTNIEQIKYSVSDNFEDVEITVTLDDINYEGVKPEKGKHLFFIKAKDKAGNETIVEIDFEIIEDNIIGCGTDASCYVNNYLEVVIIVGALLSFVLIMIIAGIIIKKKRKNNVKY